MSLVIEISDDKLLFSIHDMKHFTLNQMQANNSYRSIKSFFSSFVGHQQQESFHIQI